MVTYGQQEAIVGTLFPGMLVEPVPELTQEINIPLRLCWVLRVLVVNVQSIKTIVFEQLTEVTSSALNTPL
jgi:hypothetical protein